MPALVSPDKLRSPFKVGDIVARKEALEGARYVVISGAAVHVGMRDRDARQTPLGRYVAPIGFHVQSLDSGRLATFRGRDLMHVGSYFGIAGLEMFA